MENYLKTHAGNYKKFYNYFKLDSETYVALHRACKKLGIKLIDCLSKESYEKVKGQKNPLSLEEPLEDLKKRVSNLPDPKKAIEKRFIEEVAEREKYYLFKGN